ncbi:unnamed protein product [Moneuplotes crassus]|uniref:Uncharacterized protein n=1 Tax=Euplotes crassus TaxID=5936 RepID=A0AAD1XT54_EUPCR|nr:unnamed protein product [Moneuplotes crassus]
MTLSDKFTKYQDWRKEILYTDSPQEFFDIFENPYSDLEEDIATFSQAGNLEISLERPYDKNAAYQIVDEDYYNDTSGEAVSKLKHHKLKRFIKHVEKEKNEEVKVSSQPEADDCLEEITNTEAFKKKYSIKDYLDRVWCEKYCYELYTIELNKVAHKHNIPTDEIIDIAYECTADLDFIELYLSSGIKRIHWSKVEDLALQSVMKERSIKENGIIVQEEDIRDSYSKTQYQYLLEVKGVDQIKKRCRFLGIEYIDDY